MNLTDSLTFSIENFEGPLELLWHLINRQEIDIYEVPLQQITQQFLTKCKEIEASDIDNAAEFIALAALLVWQKSKTLLPIHEQPSEPNLEEEDPRFEIIHHLLDYCRFKQAAKMLSSREEGQAAFYLRGVDTETEAKKKLGIDHLSLDDLATLFREILAKTSSQKGIIQEEVWRVSDKIRSLRYQISHQKNIPFTQLFSSEKSREELIVTFLALLELMKSGEIRVINDRTKNMVCIIATA